jgi:methionyl-tRNA synthetase
VINFEDFQKVDIRIGKVLSVEKVADSNKLYKLVVDFGSKLGERQVVSGLSDRITTKELKDGSFPFVVNIEPAIIMGLESQAMILVAEDGKELGLLRVSKDLTPGSKIH